MGDDADPIAVLFDQPLRNTPRIVGTAVVHDDKLPVPERLSQDAFNRLGEELSLSIAGDDDGDRGIPLV